MNTNSVPGQYSNGFNKKDASNVIRRGGGFNIYRDKYNPETNICLEIWGMEGVNLHVKNGKVMIIMPSDLAADIGIVRPGEMGGNDNEYRPRPRPQFQNDNQWDRQQPTSNASSTGVQSGARARWPGSLTYEQSRGTAPINDDDDIENGGNR